MADGWARTPSSIFRGPPRLSVASAPRRARASQPGAKQQSQRRRGRSEPGSTHRRALRRLWSARSSVASCQLLPPLPDEHRLPDRAGHPDRRLVLLAAQGRHPRPRMPARSGRPAAKDGQSRCKQPERRPRAQPSAEKLFRLRRAAGREVPARLSWEAGRGGGRALAHWPAWSPRPRDNNKAPTPGACVQEKVELRL